MRVVGLFVVFCAVEMVLLLVLADYTSWQFALLEILASGLLGLAVTRYVTSQFGHRIVSRLAAQEFPGDVLAHGAILYVAGVLLVLPGVMSDVVGLLLLLPPVRWLVVAHLRRWFIAQFIHTPLSDGSPDGGRTIDCDHTANDARAAGD